MSDNQDRIIVIGAGPGGYAAAFHAADLGLDVTLIDPEANPGGVCLYRGCIPTKALLHLSKIKEEALEARDWGLEFNEPVINLDKIRAFKENVINKLTSGLGQLSAKRKINYIRGKARFVDSNTVEIIETKAKFSFNHAIIATGSRSVTLPGIPQFTDRIMDSDKSLDLKDIPATMLVIGGGYIGMEMSTIYAALGTKVTVVELLPEIMAGTDRDLVAVYTKLNKDIFEAILLETMVTSILEKQNGVKVTLQNKNKEITEKTFDKVLVSVGRRPNSEEIGLENTKVTITEKGFIIVDEQRRTTDPSIFAIGDITGNPLLAHKACHEGKVAAEVIAGMKSAFEPKCIPGVIYTNPEIATCGITETQAKKEGRKIEVAKFPWSASGRAISMGITIGTTKLIIDPETARIIGAGIVGPHAGELISEAALAIEMAATASDMAMTIHPHPTLSETLMEAADDYYGLCTHIFHPKKK